MRRKNIVACVLCCSVVALSGCVLDEVFNLDVSKNACKGVKSLEIYTLDNDGRVVDRTMCSAGDECTKNNDYRGALEYGICPEDISVCRENEKICSVCKEGEIFCGQKDRCIDPLKDTNHCGAKGLCNSSEKGDNYEGEQCPSGDTCKDGECYSETACEEGVEYPICNGNTLVECKNKIKKPTDCLKLNFVCENGACVKPPCDVETYNNSCKNDTTLVYCKEGRVDELDCSVTQKECSAGECKALRCEALNIANGTCDGKTYRTCDNDGRVVYNVCGEAETCVDGEGCKLITQCDRDACYENPTEEQKKLLRVCKNGSFEDMDCEGVAPGMYCSEGKCTCTLGSQRCYQKVDQSWRVETCIEDAGSNKWVTTEDCTSDKPICDDQEFYCHDEAQTIGSPCQMIVTDEQGKKHYCNNNNYNDENVDKYCVEFVSGKEFVNVLNQNKVMEMLTKEYGYPMGLVAMMYATLETQIEGYEDFFEYQRNIFPKDTSVIKGCANVQVPEGMSLGCLTSGASLKFNQIGNFMSAFKTAQVFSASLHAWLEKFMTEMLDTETGGVKFTAPNGYCMVGTYDLTIRGYVFDSLFTAPKNADAYTNNPKNYTDGWNSLGLHENPEEKLSSLIDIVNTKSRHKDALKAQCPEGTFGFHYTEPIMRDMEDFIGRLGYDVCLKVCESDSDCRNGYRCITMPTRAPDQSESPEDVMDAGDKQKACMNSDTYKVMRDMRYKVFGGAERPTKEECAKDPECKGSIERDWKDDNNHYEPAQ